MPGLPKEMGQHMTIELPGLPSKAKKLILVRVPGRGSVEPFYMGKYEITQGQYQALMADNPSRFKKGPNYPVEQVTWDEAKEFCRRLTARLPESFKGKVEFRLPTDAEWSMAVGLPDESGHTPEEKSGKIKDVYPCGRGGPLFRRGGNYSTDPKGHKGSTVPVGSFGQNRFGLYDLGGNVWEWCEDFYDRNRAARVLRGASWDTIWTHLQWSSHRDQSAAASRYSAYGFRVVLGVAAGIARPEQPTR